MRQRQEHLAGLFAEAHITSEAKNITDERHPRMGVCQARGHCALCSNDAKARPETTFPSISIYQGTRVEELVFEGERVVAARCVTGEEGIGVRARAYFTRPSTLPLSLPLPGRPKRSAKR